MDKPPEPEIPEVKSIPDILTVALQLATKAARGEANIEQCTVYKDMCHLVLDGVKTTYACSNGDPKVITKMLRSLGIEVVEVKEPALIDVGPGVRPQKQLGHKGHKKA